MPNRPHIAATQSADPGATARSAEARARRPPTFSDAHRRQIEAHLREAFRTLRALPDREWSWLNSGKQSSWPDTLREAAEVFANAVGQGGRHEDMRAPHLPPTPAQIDRMLPTLLWLRGAERDEKIAVAMRAMDLSWARIGRTLGVSRYKAQRAYERGIESAFVELAYRRPTEAAGRGGGRFPAGA